MSFIDIKKQKLIHVGKLDQIMVWESNDVELFGVTIYNNLRFDKHVTNICLKANRRLSIFS